MALPQRTKIFLVIFILIALAVIAYLAVFGRALLQNENHGAIFFSLPQALAGWQGGGNRQWPIFIKRAATVHQRNGKSGF